MDDLLDRALGCLPAPLRARPRPLAAAARRGGARRARARRVGRVGVARARRDRGRDGGDDRRSSSASCSPRFRRSPRPPAACSPPRASCAAPALLGFGVAGLLARAPCPARSSASRSTRARSPPGGRRAHGSLGVPPPARLNRVQTALVQCRRRTGKGARDPRGWGNELEPPGGSGNGRARPRCRAPRPRHSGSLALAAPPGTVAPVVLSWNRREDTLACLRSLAAVEEPKLATILVDNASTDGTVEAVRAGFPEVEVLVNDTNLGFAEGNNVGIRRALELQAEWVLILNNDVEVDPGFLGALLEEAARRPDAGALSPLILFGPPSETIWFAGATLRPAEGLQRAAARLRRAGRRGVRRGVGDRPDLRRRDARAAARCFEEVGDFDTGLFAYYEDTDWSLRARAAGHRLYVVPAGRIWHKVSRSSGGESSPATLYYGTRNALVVAERAAPLGRVGTWRRRLVLLAAHLVQAVALEPAARGRRRRARRIPGLPRRAPRAPRIESPGDRTAGKAGREERPLPHDRGDVDGATAPARRPEDAQHPHVPQGQRPSGQPDDGAGAEVRRAARRASASSATTSSTSTPCSTTTRSAPRCPRRRC